MGGDVRTTVGVPKLSAFANGSGTPLVIDTLTGQGYFTEKNAVVPISASGGDAAPSFLAKGNTAQVFADSTQTVLTNYVSPAAGNPAGWNPVTGEYTVQKTGWYSLSLWANAGQNAAKFLALTLRAANLSSVVRAIAVQNIPTTSSPRTYLSGTVCAPSYFVAGEKISCAVLITWGDSLPHDLTGGTLDFSIVYLHA